MQPALKWPLAVAATAFLGLAMNGPATAQGVRHFYGPSAYSAYQNPDGSYDSPSDLSRDIRGVPCGIECTREAQARWSRYYGHR